MQPSAASSTTAQPMSLSPAPAPSSVKLADAPSPVGGSPSSAGPQSSLSPAPAPSSVKLADAPSPGAFPVNKGTTTGKPELPDGSPSPTQGSVVKTHNSPGTKNNVVTSDTEESHISAGEWVGIIGGGSLILIPILCFLKNRCESSRSNQWLYSILRGSNPNPSRSVIHPVRNPSSQLELVELGKLDDDNRL